MKRRNQFFVAMLFFALACSAHGLMPADSVDATALTAVTRQVCGREVVMLGESASHGDGHAEAFKVALVEKLIQECGFDSVFFEASHYEFINITRHLRMSKAVSVHQVSAAIGGLWNFDQEFQPLVPFLLAQAIAGKISLGGIDDQLGQAGQDYANLTMISNLTMVLPQPQGQKCSLAFHRRIYSENNSDADRPEITSCLSDIRRAYAEDESAKDKSMGRVPNEEWLELIDAVQRWIARDSLSIPQQIVARDKSMVSNFQWLRRQQPQRHKIILWAATVHIAKQGDPAWADRTGSNFGSFLHREYGEHAFSLGFSSLTGTYREGREVHPQPLSPPNSLEAQALRQNPSTTAFLGPAQLGKLGAVPGAVFTHSYQSLPWSVFLDGVVVFPSEHPPTRITPD